MNLFSKLLLGLDTKAFRSGIANADRSLKKFSGQLKNIGGLIGASFAGAQIASFTKEAVSLGSELSKASAGFARFGNELDLAKLREQTRGLVTDVQLMQKTVMGANLGIPFKDMGVLLEFAKRRADETGESLDNLISSIVEGVGRKSTRRLDNLGIAADRLKAKVGGISLEMATVADVSRAMVDIANEELAKMGPASETATDAIDRLAVSWANLKAEIGQDIAPAVTTAVSGLEEFWRATVALYQGRYFKDIIRPMLESDVTPTMPGVPNATVPPNPNPPQDRTTAAPFGVYAPAPTTLQSMQEALKALQDQFEVVEINTKAFFELRTEIEKLEQQIKDVTQGVVPQTEAIKLQAKATNDVYQAQERSLMIMRQIPAAGNAYTEWVKGIKKAYEEWNQEIEVMNYLGQQFGSILTSSFNSALEGGENFFTVMGDALKKYMQQLMAAIAATTVLSVISAAAGVGSFAEAFNNIGGGMGLPFGIGDNGNLKFRISGYDLITGPDRESKRLLQLGAYGK